MQRILDAFTDEQFDLLILGGGITGAGVALDAVLRGLRVALIDKGDFASGTSSVSSKLVHGGLRYLEHGEIRLVYEALHERRRLLHNAPHLVRPLRFVLPFYRGARVPPWKWRLGLTLYDVLAGRGNLQRSRPLSSAPLWHEFPGLRRDDLLGGATFYDAQTDDARLCIEVLRTAAAHGARVANYVEAVAFEFDAGRIRGVRALDHIDGREVRIRARQVLNATGPWGDALRRLAGDDTGPAMRPTKGVHVVAPDRGLHAALLLLHPHDGRVFFVIPWLGKTLLGTTDTECDDAPDAPRITDEDVRYLLDGHNHYFDPPLTAGELLGAFAGLRPLLRADAGDPSARSRDFRLLEAPSGLLTVAGGKYTTYRHIAEVVTDKIVLNLNLSRRCRTGAFLLDGAPSAPWERFASETTARLSNSFGLRQETALHLVRRYGRRADDVTEYFRRDPALAQPVTPGEPDLLAEFAYQRDHEMALRPADFLLRRTRLGLFRRSLLENPPRLTRPARPAFTASPT